MKRFYAQASVGEAGQILLDGKQLRMPDGCAVQIPIPVLAEAVAEEWQQQPESINWFHLPLTRLAAAATSATLEDLAQWRDECLDYLPTDLICYLSPDAALATKQETYWQPVRLWVEQQFSFRLPVTMGIQPLPQDSTMQHEVEAWIKTLSPAMQCALHRACLLSGSFWLAAAWISGALAMPALIEAIFIEENESFAKWGEDAEARAAMQSKTAELELLDRFVILVGGSQ